MALIDELKDRADKLDAEMLALSGRLKEIERESDDVHTCINALDIAAMDAEDIAISALGPAPAELLTAEEVASVAEFVAQLEAEPEPKYQTYRNADDMGYPAPIRDEPVEHISILTGDPAIEPESGLHGEPVPEPQDDPDRIADLWQQGYSDREAGYQPALADEKYLSGYESRIAIEDALARVDEQAQLAAKGMPEDDDRTEAEPHSIMDRVTSIFRREKEDA